MCSSVKIKSLLTNQKPPLPSIQLDLILVGHQTKVQKKKNYVDEPLTRIKPNYLRRSASIGSVPGKLIVIEEGAPTSYVLTGILHSPKRTISPNNMLHRNRMGTLKRQMIIHDDKFTVLNKAFSLNKKNKFQLIVNEYAFSRTIFN